MVENISLTGDSQNSSSRKNIKFLKGITRAFGGSIIFTLPMLMTMEMWHLGFSIERFRIVLLLLITLPLLVGLSYQVGFEETKNILNDIIDAFVAYLIGIISSVIILSLFSVINFAMPADEIIGKIAIQAIPGSIGALLAQAEFNIKENETEKSKRNSTYHGEIFLMAAGSIYLAFNLAPTEEIILISYMMSEFQVIILMLLSLSIIHVFVYLVEFRGQEKIPEGSTHFSILLRYSVVGYAAVFLTNLFVLWTFGRIDGLSLEHGLIAVIVLSFPGSVGAAAARLIL